MSVYVRDTKCRATIAMLIFNNLLHKHKVISQVIANMPKDMDYINLDPENIADTLDSHLKRGYVPLQALKFYKPWYPWSKAYAATISGNYSMLKLSTRKLDREIESLCGSIAHEWGHCWEFFFKQYVDVRVEFNHGDNTRKDNTFQYQLGIRVKKYVKEYKEELLREVGSIS